MTEDTHTETASDSAENSDPVDYWRKHQRWPGSFLESKGNMSQLPSRKRSASTLRRTSPRTSLAPSDTTPSDDKGKEAGRASYRHAGYEILLNSKHVYMDDCGSGVSIVSKDLCRRLLEAEQLLRVSHCSTTKSLSASAAEYETERRRKSSKIYLG